MMSAEYPQIRNFIIVSLLAHLIFAGLLSAVPISARLPADRPLRVQIVDQPIPAVIRPSLEDGNLGEFTARTQRTAEKVGPPRTPNSSGLPHLESAFPSTAILTPPPASSAAAAPGASSAPPTVLTLSTPPPLRMSPGLAGTSNPKVAQGEPLEGERVGGSTRLSDLRGQLAMLWKSLDARQYPYEEADTGEEGDTGSATERTISLDSQDSRFASYLLGVKRRIESLWSYPPEGRGLTGNLLVTFGITRDGHLRDLQLTQTSGIAPLDNEAIRAIRQAAPFAPFPERMRFERLNIRAAFYYYANRAGVRDR